MQKLILARCGLLRAAAAVALAGLVAACASDLSEPAPVIMKGAELGMPAAAAPPRGAARQIVVRPGQSLRGIAHAYHVKPRAIIAANQLTPPYKVLIGQRLVVPAGGGPPLQRTAAAAPPAMEGPAMTGPSMTGPSMSGPAMSGPAVSGPAMSGPAMSGPPPAGHPPPEIIPLDGPAPGRQARAASQPPRAAPALAAKPAAEPSAAREARAEPAAPAAPAATALPHSGHFPWPVRGRVLAGYGVAAGGVRNDGINIAAPQGAPVASIDGGVVAYVGNEIPGYGNLVLVKHPSGWISAYAHCEDLLVKRGEKVYAGQTIARVGATGGVSEPQLHFELRRGKKAVDPREFLGPAPSADTGRRPANG